MKPAGHHGKSCPCPECVERRATRDMRWLLVAALLAVLVVGSLLQLGCTSTVTPAPVQAREASFDGAEQNSGLLALVPGGALITPRARDRYNALVATYGAAFAPALERDHGITPQGSDFLISNEALQKFVLMNSWRRMGRAPASDTPTK